MQRKLLRISVLLGTVAVTMLSYSVPSKSVIIRIKNHDDGASAHPRIRLTVDNENGNTSGPARKKETPAEYAARHARMAEERRQKEIAYRARLEEQAKKLGLGRTTNDSIDVLKANIQEKRAEKQRKFEREAAEAYERNIKATAEKRGLSSSGSVEEVRERLWQQSDERDAARSAARTAHREFMEHHRKCNDEMLILRAAERKPGERVDYKTRLEERHAFSRRGLYDAGLCRHSDDIVQQNMLDSYTRSYDDIVREARERGGKNLSASAVRDSDRPVRLKF